MGKENNHSYYNSNALAKAVRLAKEKHKILKPYADIINQNKATIEAVVQMQKPIRNIQKQIGSVQKLMEQSSTSSEYLSNSITLEYMNYFKEIGDPKTIDEIQVVGDSIASIAPLGWPYTKKYLRGVYLLAFKLLNEVNDDAQEEELNDFFTEAVEEFVLSSVSREDFKYGFETGWVTTIDYVIEQVRKKNLLGAIPMLFICIEHVFAKIDGSVYQVKNPGPTRKGFEQKTHDKNILSFLTYRNNGIMLPCLVRKKIFGSENQTHNILNRNRVSHGKSNPESWSVKDMYQLLTVLLCLCEVSEEYYYHLERGAYNE